MYIIFFSLLIIKKKYTPINDHRMYFYFGCLQNFIPFSIVLQVPQFVFEDQVHSHILLTIHFSFL